MITYSKFRHEWKVSKFAYAVPTSKDYKVYVNGEEIPVYTCRISSYPFNTHWPGHQRSVNQTELVSYVNLIADEEIRIEVEPLTKTAYERIMVKPYSKGIKTEQIHNRIVFTLKENGAYVFELDDYHGLLYIFNNKPVVCDNPDSVTYYFGKGVHFPGKIVLKSNESVYVDKDALVYGCIFAENAENIRIYGNGIFDDSGEERFCEPCYEPYTNGNVKFYDCKNIKLEGVGFTNSAIWCVNLFHCYDVEIDGINVFGQWRYNTDGIDIMNSQRIIIRNSFVHSFDDTITVKGIDRYASYSNTDMLFENCVLWCDWGKTCEIGLETNCPEYKNITFRNCDILRAGNAACDIQNGDCADVHDIIFEDIRVELENFYTPAIIQWEQSMVYDKQNELEIPAIVNIVNYRFRDIYGFLDGVQNVSPYEKQLDDERFASVRNVEVKNIQIYCDEKIFETKNPKEAVNILISNEIATSTYSGIAIKDISMNGKHLTEDDISVTLNGNVGTVKIETETNYESIKKNTVTAKGQLGHNENITYVNPNGCGMRVMFVGNSITRHGVKEDIGWHLDCGMAASCLEHDYVHVIIKEFNQTNSDVAYCICQCADWEREYLNGEAWLTQYSEARDFEADIIIMRIIENCPWDEFDGTVFKREYDRLISYFNKTGKAKIILTTGFWHHVGDEMIKEYAIEKKYQLVELGDLGDDDVYKAISLFEHGGVACHPNDLGMKEIAIRILPHMVMQ